nr:hypothetical protein [uncultured Draconibacterium sp.]
MKKQILFLTLFVAAILVGNNAFGQTYTMEPTTAPTCINATTLAGCTADELHPVQGADYTYTVDVTAATDVVRWFVVDNTAMELAGDELIGASGILPIANGAIDDGSGTDPYILNVVTGTYNSGVAAAGATSSITLNWKYFDGVSNEILLVAYVETDPTCTDNIAVMRIIPTPAFTIDVASINEAGANPAGPTDTPNEECVSPIESASYTSATNTTPDQTNEVLTVDYGENWVFFVVNGANYIDSWAPTFRITYDAGYEAIEAEWTYLSEFTAGGTNTWTTINSIDGSTQETTPIIAGGSSNSAGAGVVPTDGGECIIVRVRVDYGTDNEHDQADGTLNFAVDGTAYDGDNTAGTFYDDTAFDDLMNNGATGTACTPDGFDNDNVDYLITPRPQVEEGSPAHELKTGQGVN